MDIKRTTNLHELLLQINSGILVKGVKQEQIKKLERRFKLTKVELATFAVCYAYWLKRPEIQKMAPLNLTYYPISQIVGNGYMFDNIIQRLEELNIIEVNRSSLLHEYAIPAQVLESINANKAPFIMSEKPSVWYLCDQLSIFLSKIKKTKAPLFSTERGLRNIEKAFSSVNACQLLINLKLSYEERLTYYIMLVNVVQGEDVIDISTLLDDYNIPYTRLMPFRKLLLSGESELTKRGYFTADKERLYNNGHITLLPEISWVTTVVGTDFNWVHKKDEFQRSFYSKKEYQFNILDPNNIQPMNLFYNEREAEELANISDLLEENRYTRTINYLREEGQRTAITILLSGGPGTGKTETAQQWARLQQRKIYWVDFAQLSSQWVGENEKAVRKIFEDYRNLSAKEKRVPIFLLNEADGLLSKRVSVQRSVDKMSNTVQNILLEEIEMFSGILIATTNHIRNLDTAFLRRFLFKVHIDNPNISTREHLLKQFTFLNPVEINSLAKISFSGGQLDNIRRRILLFKITKDELPAAEAIRNWLGQELNNGAVQTNKQLGFHSMSKVA